jgi:hypothetical protein
MFDYVIVEKDEVEDKLDEGWCRTTPEALEASMDDDMKRKAIEAEATKLEIQFDGRTSTKKLEAAVAEKKQTSVGY